MTFHANSSEEGTLSKLRSHLDHIDPDIDYGNWLKALMVIFHETKGSDAGLALADEWSSRGRKYRNFQDIEYRWNRFKISHKNPVRMGTLIRMARA
jgi:hypothetical protein